MKYGKLFKFNMLILMLAVSAGLIFLTCAFLGRLPKNITVNGVEVGGRTPTEAAACVRERIEEELKTKSLTVRGKQREYVFTYPEISYKDNLQALLKTVEKGGDYTAEVKYYLNGISEISAYICKDETRAAVTPHAIFNTSGEPFTHVEGEDGVKADRVKLLSDIRASLESGFEDVTVSYGTTKFTGSLDEVKLDTEKLSSFTTYFDGENYDRAHNVRLAAKLINGKVLEVGEIFSFNTVVGARTAARGFKAAKIIENGEFVEGIGGGVCQVSTTIYNAALLAGCEICEYHPHSLAVSYVPPSYDAMVSGNYFDLKFKNTSGKKLYIRATAGANYVRFTIFGRSDGATYEFNSKVTGNIAAPEEVTGDESAVKEGRDGIISEGYLTVTRNGIKRTVLLRRDKYAPVKRVVLESTDNKQD